MTKLLTAAFLILSSLVGPAAEDEKFDLQLLSPKGRNSYVVLARTGIFGFGPSEEREQPDFSDYRIESPPSEGDRALHLLMKEEFAKDALLRLAGEADLPGQMYTLCGLHAKDAQLFSQALKIYQSRSRGRSARVVMKSRGQSGDLEARGIIKDIQAGRYDKDVTSRVDFEYMSEAGQKYYQDLRGAESFDLSDNNPHSKNQHALQALLKEEGPVSILNHLIDNAKAPGQMYALCGLHALDEGSFDRAVRKLKGKTGKIMVMSERSAKETEIPEVIEMIDSGQYDAFVR